MFRISIILLGVWIQASVANANGLLDFSPVQPPAIDKQVMVKPEVSWEVRPDAQAYCQQVSESDGYAIWRAGCVHWSKMKQSCTIVTPEKTSHSMLGHLFLLCLSAGESS